MDPTRKSPDIGHAWRTVTKNRDYATADSLRRSDYGFQSEGRYVVEGLKQRFNSTRKKRVKRRSGRD